MDHPTHQPRVPTQGPNNQPQIILLCTYFAKTQLSGDASSAGKVEGERTSGNKVAGSGCPIGRARLASPGEKPSKSQQ